MHRSLLRRFALGILAGLTLAAPGEAVAATGATDVGCMIFGSATADVKWGPNTGTYSFGPTGLGIDCIVAGGGEGTQGPAASAGLVEVLLGSTGSFDNVTCGTGAAADPDPIVTSAWTIPHSDYIERVLLESDFGYKIVFTDQQGVLTWEDTLGFPSMIPSPRLQPTDTAPVGGGYVNIYPWHGAGHPLGDQGGTYPGNPPNGSCTNGFNVEGVVSATLARAPEPA